MNHRQVHGEVLAVCNQILKQVVNLGLGGATLWNYRGGQRRLRNEIRHLTEKKTQF